MASTPKTYLFVGLLVLARLLQAQSEFVVDQSFLPGSAYTPAVAFDGQQQYLVVWEDRTGGDRNILGTRLNQDATPIDTAQIVISSATGNQTAPALTYGAGCYLVTWQDTRSGTSDIYAARVRSNGYVLDPTGIPVSIASDVQSSPSVAFDGTNFIVVWQDKRSGGLDFDIYGARISPLGSVIDPNGIPISVGDEEQSAPRVAFGGAYYLVAWQDYRNTDDYDIYCCRVTTAGQVVDDTGVCVSTSGSDDVTPAVASSGSNYLVVWAHEDDDDDIYGAIVSQDGGVTPKTICRDIDDQDSPSATFAGTQYFVVWQDCRGSTMDVYGARVGPAGDVIDQHGIAISSAAQSQSSPAVAGQGMEFQGHITPLLTASCGSLWSSGPQLLLPLPSNHTTHTPAHQSPCPSASKPDPRAVLT